MGDSGKDETRVKVWAFRPEGEGSPMIVDDPAIIAECFLKEMDEGEKYVVECRTMKRHELDELPEHVGW